MNTELKRYGSNALAKFIRRTESRLKPKLKFEVLAELSRFDILMSPASKTEEIEGKWLLLLLMRVKTMAAFWLTRGNEGAKMHHKDA